MAVASRGVHVGAATSTSLNFLAPLFVSTTTRGPSSQDVGIATSSIAAPPIAGAGISISTTTPPVIANDAPYPAADATKLAGIEAGAQVNPRHVVQFASQDANGSAQVNSGTWYAIKADNSQWQDGDPTNIAAIEIGDAQAAYGQDATSPATPLTYTAFRSLFDNRAERGGGIVCSVARHGDTHVNYVRATLVSYNATDNAYTLSNLVWANVKNYGPGQGYSWNWACMQTDGIIDRDIYGGVDWAVVHDAPDFVTRADLEGRESDRYASYTNAFIAAGYRRGAMSMFTNTSGAPTDATAIRQPDIADGSGTIAFSAYLRTDKDPNHLQWAAIATSSAYALGDVFYVRVYNYPAAHVKVTLTSAGVDAGTGDGAYVYARATWDEVNEIPDVANFGDYFLIARELPTDLAIRIPASDVLDAPGLRPVVRRLTTPLSPSTPRCLPATETPFPQASL